MKWFEYKRQEWIGESLRIFGFIQRKHLMLKFGISMPQASADLKIFQRNNPHAVVYNSSTKRYEAK